MKKILIILLLLSGNTFAGAKKVKEINGVKIPKGLVATFDALETQYCVSIVDAYTLHFPLEIRIKNTGKGFYPVIDINYSSSDWLWVENSTLYIENENQNVLKFVYNWQDRLTEVNRGIREYTYSTNPKLFEFISENISEKSKLSIRFTGSRKYILIELSKSNVKKLYSMLQLYRDLTKK